MKPYYQDDWATIYHGDCREILPGLDPVDVIVTDPPWPGPPAAISGSDDPYSLWNQAVLEFPRLSAAHRIIVILGQNTDVRFLSTVPIDFKFLTVCWLRRIPPVYRGSVLISAEVAYVFGDGWISVPGHRVIPAEYTTASTGKKDCDHPCSRPQDHLQWLLHRYTRPNHVLLDPFCGSGTMLRAAKDTNRKCIGIEIEERYAEMAVKRLAQEVFDFTP